MAIDYNIYDLKKSFTIQEAAWIWAETEYGPENAQKAYQSIFPELLRDVKGNYLQHRVNRDIRKNWINWDSDYSDHTDWSQAEVGREDLKRWAEARGQKPKFLFPEMRPKPEAKEVPAPVKNIEPQPKTKRENEMHTFLEKVYLVLRSELKRSPDAGEIIGALKNRREELDNDEIIQGIDKNIISWMPADGNEGRNMGKKTVQNYISKLNKKHEKQKIIKKIPA